METLQEMVQFLQPSQRLDLKAVAVMHVLGLTGSEEGKEVIFDVPEVIELLFRLTNDAAHSIAKDSVLCLINLTSEEQSAVKVFKEAKKHLPKFNLVEHAIESIVDENSELADPWTMVLSNLTRVESIAADVINELENDESTILKLVKAFSKLEYNKKKAKLHYVGPIFCNLTQTSRGRELFCSKKYNLLERVVIPFVTYKDSIIRRGGSIGILKNICFDPVYHSIMLNEKNDDILYSILYPLAGPEEFTAEENEMFPIELQFLGEDKQREDDPDLRIMLMESLLQLCASLKYREILRSKGVYEILREYHKWEAAVGGDKNALLACENVVDILIKKEEEIGLDNYKEVDVPEHLTKQFIEDDIDFVQN